MMGVLRPRWLQTQLCQHHLQKLHALQRSVLLCFNMLAYSTRTAHQSHLLRWIYGCDGLSGCACNKLIVDEKSKRLLVVVPVGSFDVLEEGMHGV